MADLARNALSVAFLLLTNVLALNAAPATCPQTCLPVKVGFVDYSRANEQTVQGGQQVAAHIFNKIRIDIRWMDASSEADQATQCDYPSQCKIFVRLIRRSASAVRWSGEWAYAASFRPPGATGAGLVAVFYDHVEESARAQKLSPAVILGHVLAHELGHLLLPNANHSQDGIMRAHFDAAEWQLASQGALLFNAREARLMRNGLLRPPQASAWPPQ